MPRYGQIVSTGRYVPDKVITNAELEAMLGEPVDQWLVENVGIRARHLMRRRRGDVRSGRLRRAAGARTGERRAGSRRSDHPGDGHAGLRLAGHGLRRAVKLGAPHAGTFDLNSACAAWVIGLDQACRYIATDDTLDHILVIGAYGMTRYIDWTDKRTCTLFGDGAGAVLVSAGDQPGFLGGNIKSDGAFHDYMGVFIGGTLEPTGGDGTPPAAPRNSQAFSAGHQ